MNRKLYWGIVPLVILLGITGVLIFIGKTDTETKPVYKAPSQDVLENLKNTQETQTPIVDADNGTPDEKTNGHFQQDGTWHAVKQNTSVSTINDPHTNRVVTEADKKAYFKFWEEQGLDSPPPGHYYADDDDRKLVLRKYNEPYFTVRWSEDEAPGAGMEKLSFHEWQRYHILQFIDSCSPLTIPNHQIKDWVAGNLVLTVKYSPGVQELASGWAFELRKKGSAPVASLRTTITWDHIPTPAEKAEVNQKGNELLESLNSPKRTGDTDPPQITQALVDAVVSELESELARR